MEEKPNLGENKTDLAVAITKGTLGAIPFVGGIAAEIVGVLIPRQRLDRLAEFLTILSEKMAEIEQNLLDQKMKTEEFVELFEDGMWQAARALTRERKEYIASLLKNSLCNDELNHIQQKELLSLLNELNDIQIIILKSKEFGYRSEAQQAFYEQHKEIIESPMVHVGVDEEDVNNLAMHRAFVNDLQRLGLIETTFKKPKAKELPEMDIKTGMIKAQSSRITRLGKLLLRYIDIAEAA